MEAVDIALRITQIAVAFLGFCAVVITIRQKTDSDNRAEWWKRYTWAIERMEQDTDSALLHLKVLSDSPLATKTEGRIIQDLFYKDVLDDTERDDNDKEQQS